VYVCRVHAGELNFCISSGLKNLNSVYVRKGELQDKLGNSFYLSLPKILSVSRKYRNTERSVSGSTIVKKRESF